MNECAGCVQCWAMLACFNELFRVRVRASIHPSTCTDTFPRVRGASATNEVQCIGRDVRTRRGAGVEWGNLSPRSCCCRMAGWWGTAVPFAVPADWPPANCYFVQCNPTHRDSGSEGVLERRREEGRASALERLLSTNILRPHADIPDCSDGRRDGARRHPRTAPPSNEEQRRCAAASRFDVSPCLDLHRHCVKRQTPEAGRLASTTF